MKSGLDDLFIRSKLFSRLDADQRSAVSRCAIKRTLPQENYLSHYADIWPYLFLVSSGRIEGTKESGKGRRLIVLSLEPGDIFWGLAFFTDHAVNPVSLCSREESEVYLWQREDLLPILCSAPDVLWKLCQLMSVQMQNAGQIVEGLAFQAVPTRLASLLVKQFSSAGEQSILRSLTLDEIAARIGTTREQACRALYQLADEHLIEITRTEFSLTDEPGLKKLSGTS